MATICNDLEALLAERLQNADPVSEIAEEIAERPDGIQAVGLLLLLLEKNERLDWGTPGSVVHAVEGFFTRGYEPLLLESLRRAPTNHTLWMANRLIGGVPQNQQGEFLSAIREVAVRNDVPVTVRQRALYFLESQKSKG